jgi:hypothetical protein
MKKTKAISWEKISEGFITADEIIKLQTNKQPISLVLWDAVNTPPLCAKTITIVPSRGPVYNVINNVTTGSIVNKKPYKYLSCAVRKSVSEYKTALRTGKWRVIEKK